MFTVTACPTCGHRAKVADEHCGKRVRCPRCRDKFFVPLPDVPFQAGRRRRAPAFAVVAAIVAIAAGAAGSWFVLKDSGKPAAPVALREDRGAVVSPKTSDPVSELEALCTAAGKKGTSPRIVYTMAPMKWVLRRHTARELKFDVRRSDSLVSPYTGSVWWQVDDFSVSGFASRQDAEKAIPRTIPLPPTKSKEENLATFAYHDGKWRVAELRWDCDLPPELERDIKVGHLSSRFSEVKSEDPNHFLWDWWWAFGGTGDAGPVGPTKKIIELERFNDSFKRP